MHMLYIISARHLLNSGKSGSVQEIANMLVESYVKIDNKMEAASKDQIFLYACEIMTRGLFWKNYHDACNEGDGERIIMIWKYLLIIFKLSSRKNYTKEAILLLLQCKCLQSERKVAQMLHSRSINIQGHNIPCDLHMEHLNRRLKTILNHLGSNIQPETILKVASPLELFTIICNTFQHEVQCCGTFD